jgi:hypothetical protein
VTRPDKIDYGDAAFDGFQTPSSVHGKPVTDTFGDPVVRGFKPMFLVPTVALAILGAWAIFTPLPALVAVVLGVHARRRGIRGAGVAVVFSMVCVGIGVWAMHSLCYWG